jgi:hypothetical protein
MTTAIKGIKHAENFTDVQSFCKNSQATYFKHLSNDQSPLALCPTSNLLSLIFLLTYGRHFLWNSNAPPVGLVPSRRKTG